MNNRNLIIKEKNKAVETMALKIAEQSPELNDLTHEQLEQIAKLVIIQNLTNELNNKSKVANIDYNTEKGIFLIQASRTGRNDTQTAYLKAILKPEKYTKKNGINILQMTPA
jgi:hypothetical protein